jgi:hypothetical protein
MRNDMPKHSYFKFWCSSRRGSIGNSTGHKVQSHKGSRSLKDHDFARSRISRFRMTQYGENIRLRNNPLQFAGWRDYRQQLLAILFH